MHHEDYCFVQDIAIRNNIFKVKMQLKAEIQIQKEYMHMFIDYTYDTMIYLKYQKARLT